MFKSFISLDCGLEKGLIALKEHARLNWDLFVQVEPCTIRTLFGLVAVLEHPFTSVQIEVDRSLHLGEKFVIDSNVAVGRAANHNFLLLELAAVEVGLI